jgi:dTDP-4-dehydrorhamnose 3,5-epimerase-like enzyme
MNTIYVKNAHWISTQKIVDGHDGILSVANEMDNIPFDIKRVYYIYNLINHRNVMRGKHAHKSLEQVMFCLNGECTVTLDDGKRKQTIILDQPNKGIFLGTNLWHTMQEFNSNCILLVFASQLYSEDDYIRDYDEFLETVKSPHLISQIYN